MRKVLSVILLVLGLFQAASAQSVLQQRITTPDGRIVLIVSNTSSKQCQIKIQYKGEFADVYLPAGAVGTYQWKI